MRQPRFVITQVGHTGSAYTHYVLSRAGVPTGHESFYGPHGLRGNVDRRLVGDSSWCAVAWLDEYRGTVFHQWRHPLKVVRSLAGGPFGTNQPGSAWTQLRRALLGDTTGSLLGDVVKLVVTMNRAGLARAEASWRVEDFGPDEIRLCADAGRVAARDIQEALASVPKSVNKHNPVPLDWDDLPAGEWTDALLDQTLAAGYDLDPE